MGTRLLLLVLPILKDQPRVLLAIDDSPTKRYGPHVQGAGIHHDPTPGPSGNAFCYGHVWVTLAVIARHPSWGTIGLPIFAWLYVRQQDVPQIPTRFRWTFQTKLEQAADLVLRAARWLSLNGKPLWVVADGAYAKRPFVQPLLQRGITLVGRLRKDAAVFDLPPVETQRRRGRPRIYGVNRLSLAKRAAHRHGWQEVACTVYGTDVVKRVKTFRATHRTFGGAIRVVDRPGTERPTVLLLHEPRSGCDGEHRNLRRPLRDRAGVPRREGGLGGAASSRCGTCGPTSRPGTSTCGSTR